MALKGVRVLELAGLAPAPFCGMILADFGASVIRIDRIDTSLNVDVLARGKRSIALDLQRAKGVEIMKRMSMTCDVVVEPFRPGKMEKLGLGPTVLQKLNPGLIYARLSGFGQNGPLAHMAGHDINFVAISGILSMLASPHRKPTPPINLLGDFAGGGLLCAFGICLALLERTRSGKGQVVDSSMTEGAAYVGSWLWKSQKLGSPLWGNAPGCNVLDGGAAFYQTYATKDGKYMAVGALEPKFYSDLLKGLELDEDEFPQYSDGDKLQAKFAERFSTKTQKEWWEIFKRRDACVTPVIDFLEAGNSPQAKERSSFLPGSEVAPRPAPLLSRTPAEPVLREPQIGEHTMEILKEHGYSESDIRELSSEGTVEMLTLSKL